MDDQSGDFGAYEGGSLRPPEPAREALTPARHLICLKAMGDSPDAAFDLTEAALHLGALSHAVASLGFYRDHLVRLAADTADFAARGHDEATALRLAIGGLHGYAGDTETYDDLANANLIRVIDRRKGLPVALGILYMDAARAQGWQMDGLAFPGHFLVRLETNSGERLILDPFHDLARLEAVDLRQLLRRLSDDAAELAPEHYAPVSDRAVLLRLHNNIKQRLLREGSVRMAAEALEAMIAFAPREAHLWFEKGVLCARMERLGEAIASLEHALSLGGTPEARREAATLLSKLKAQVN